MTPDEFDTSLADLESRVDRLRALYENWFRGYEKSEPTVARKEVERRVYALRKELPRNTALRFRYHQLFQRYTTLATYWQRTARQIEEGTHRLQLQRLRRRKPEDGLAATIPPRAGLGSDAPPPNSYDLNLDETLDVGKLLDEADFDQVAAALEAAPRRDATTAAPVSPPSQRSVGRFARPSMSADAPQRPSLSFDLGDEQSAPPPGSMPPRLTSLLAEAQRSVSKAPPSATPLDVLPAVPKAPRLPVGPLMTPPLRPSMPSVSLSPPAADPRSLSIPIPAVVGAGTPSRAPTPGGASLPPSVGAAPRPPSPPGLPSKAPGPRPPPPPVPSMPARAPITGSVPMPPMPSRAPGNIPLPPRPPPATPSLAAPGASLPPRQPAPTPTVSPAARPAEPSALSDQRMRRIYDEYAAARRKNNEGDVRFETLAGSIQKMLPDLHKKHQGKQIDFEVVVKDGRVGLKPRAT